MDWDAFDKDVEVSIGMFFLKDLITAH